jgi:hypothetical protein
MPLCDDLVLQDASLLGMMSNEIDRLASSRKSPKGCLLKGRGNSDFDQILPF